MGPNLNNTKPLADSVAPSSQEQPVTPDKSQALRGKQQIKDALAQVTGGAELDEYLGISSGKPLQPPSEAADSVALIDELRQTSEEDGDMSDLLTRIATHANSSGADPDTIRALMRLGRGRNSSAAPETLSPGNAF